MLLGPLWTMALAPDLKGTGIDDIGWRAFDEVDHVVKRGTKIHLITVLFHIADMGRANAVFQAQQGVPLEYGF